MQPTVETLRGELDRAEAEIATLKHSLAEAQRLLAEKEELVRILFDENPNGVVMLDHATYTMRSNRAGAILFGEQAETGSYADAPSVEQASDYSSAFGLFKADKVTPAEFSESPLARAMTGERISEEELTFVRSAIHPQGMWLAITATPVEGFGAVAVFRNVTENKRLEEELAAGIEERTQLVEQLRAAVDELSVPVIEVWRDVLAAPLVGVLDSQRCARMTERVLDELVRRKARYAIVDLTGIGVIDTATADHIARTMQSIRLLGAEGVVTGLQPQVAQTLVGLDATFQGFRTEPTLRRAIEYCILKRD